MSIAEAVKALFRREKPQTHDPAEIVAEAVLYAAQRREAMREAWGDWVDPMDRLWDDPQTGRTRLHQTQLHREFGRTALEPTTWEELIESQAIGRLLGSVAPGLGALNTLANYVVGTGSTHTAQAIKGVAVPEGLVETCQEIIDEFLDREDWIGEREKEQFVNSREDGELYLYPRLNYDMTTDVIEISPEWIKEPKGEPEKGHEYTLGVDREIVNPSKRLGYWVQWPGSEQCEWVAADEVVTIKLNSRRNYPRGVSDFEGCRQEIIQATRLIRGTTIGATLLANIPWVEQAPPGISAAQMQSWRNDTGTMSFDQPIRGGNGLPKERTIYAKHTRPGTVRHTEHGRVIGSIPINGNAQYFLDVAKAVYCLGGTTWAMPEYLMLSDASGTVYASSLVAEAPFVKNCEVEQRRLVKKDRRVLECVLENAFRSYRLQQRFGVTPRDLWSMIEVVSTCPRVASRDEDAATNRRAVLHDKGLLSRKTWAEMEELDYEQELDRGATPVETGFPMMEARDRSEAAARLLWEGYP